MGNSPVVSSSFTVKLAAKIESPQKSSDMPTEVQASIPEQKSSAQNTNSTPQKTPDIKHAAEPTVPQSEALPELAPESDTSNQNTQSDLQLAQTTHNQPNNTSETELDGILTDTSQFTSIALSARQAHKAYPSVELQYDTLPYLAIAENIIYPEELVTHKTTLTFSIAENQTYKIIGVTRAADRSEVAYATSEGDVNHHGLKPQKFTQKVGESDINAKTAEFSWADGMVEIRNGSHVKAVRLSSALQDELSYLFQFMFAPPILPVASVNANDAFAKNPNNPLPDEKFTPLGVELIHTKGGEYKTVRILKNNDAYHTEIWLAIDYQFLPVKIRRTTGDVITEQMLTSVRLPP